MAKNLLKELDTQMRNIKQQMVEWEELDDTECVEVQKKFEALCKVQKYVDNFSWLKHQQAKEKIKLLRESDYNYEKVAEYYGVSVGAIKVFMHYASEKLKEKIGESTIGLIVAGDITVAMTQFSVLSGEIGIETLICQDALKLLPEYAFKPSDLADCKNELRFLYEYSQAVMKFRYSHMNKDKMAFVLYVLMQNSPKYAEEKSALVNLLLRQDGLSFDKYYEDLKLRSKKNI